jgi:hypothetical protein
MTVFDGLGETRGWLSWLIAGDFLSYNFSGEIGEHKKDILL